jgi:hypothetical protein
MPLKVEVVTITDDRQESTREVACVERQNLTPVNLRQGFRYIYGWLRRPYPVARTPRCANDIMRSIGIGS